MIKWEQDQTWQGIAEIYLCYVQRSWEKANAFFVIFDGFGSSSKDHEHTRHSKSSCADLKIRPEMKHPILKAKFLDNRHNKNELIFLVASFFQNAAIAVTVCDNDADTIARTALLRAVDTSVEVSL